MNMKTILLSLIAAVTMSAAQIIVIVKLDNGSTVSTTTITTTNTVLTALSNWRLAQVTQQAIPARAESYGPDPVDKDGKPLLDKDGKPIKGEVLPAFPGVPAVLKYPTVDAFWKYVIGEFFNANVLPDYHPTILAEKAKVEAANSAIAAAKAGAVQ
jgi:hypothetical protein